MIDNRKLKKMKTRHIIFYFIGLLALCSCDDMFEPAKENFRQLDDLAGESDYAHGLLMYGYGSLPYMTTTQTDIATDDAVTNLKSSTYKDMAAFGTWRSDNNPMTQWDRCKGGIQYLNLFLTGRDLQFFYVGAKLYQNEHTAKRTCLKNVNDGRKRIFFSDLRLAERNFFGITTGVDCVTLHLS